MTDQIETKSHNSQKPKESEQVLLDVQNLVKYFPIRGGILQRVQAWVKAVDDISFHIYKGETLGLVGESGCGKTTVGRTVLNLIPATSGKVEFGGTKYFRHECKPA